MSPIVWLDDLLAGIIFNLWSERTGSPILSFRGPTIWDPSSKMACRTRSTRQLPRNCSYTTLWSLFQLQTCSPEFGKYTGILYERMSSPDINSKNIWEVYRKLVHRFEHLDDAVDFIEQLQVHFNLLDDEVNIEPPAVVELHGGPDGA